MGFLNLNDLDVKKPFPGSELRLVHTGNMTFAYWSFEPGVDLPEHSHPHEQVANCLAGRFELTVDGETRELAPGDIVVVPPNVLHSGRSVTECRFLDVFHPVREDLK